MAYLHRDEYPLGPKWLPVWIRKRLPFQKEFKYSAYMHDDCYGIGGSERTRWKYDLMMYRLMVSAVDKMGASKKMA